MKLNIEIKNRWTGKLIFNFETENNTVKQTVLEALKSEADLSGADLSGADLSGANLRGANLRGANLSGADLREADLREADLRGADLSGANLSVANLSEANLSGANLSGADLRGANLREANLRGADLSGANLSVANLSGADLRGADLREANLRGADLSGANLQPIKEDLFIVLLHGKREIPFLKSAIIEGKIDGSTYQGDCACLSGTLENGATASNGEQEEKVKQLIYNCRRSSRPIERFFLAIKKGDTPENSQFSKLALEWIEEFEELIKF